MSIKAETRQSIEEPASRAMFREIETERRRREADRRRRALLVVAAVLLAVLGWRLAVRVPAGQYQVSSFPDTLFYPGGGGYYDYGLGLAFASNPSSRCGPLPSPKAGMVELGRITDVASDETGSLGYVRSGDEGPPVFENARRLGSSHPAWMLYAFSTPKCYLPYRTVP